MKLSIPYARIAALFFCLLLPAQNLFAEEIRIPVGSQNPQSATVARPTLGMSKQAVQERFGEPLQRHPAVGNPPIERWDFSSFSVYFEYDHVIHSVLPGPTPLK